MEEWLKRLGTWFTNATLSAANADAPVVTTASGWLREKDGSWNQNAVNDPGVKQLRDNIATLSMLSEGANVVPLAKAAYNVVRHPAQTAKIIKTSAELAKKYLEKYLSLVDGKRISGTFKGNRSNKTKPLADYMESLGVDSSYFTEDDLLSMINRRKASVNYPLTRPDGYSASISELINKHGPSTADISIYNNGSFSGNLKLTKFNNDSDMFVDMISKNPGEAKGFGELAYNAGLIYTNLKGFKGIRSGDELVSPEQTYSIWKKYKDKEFIGHTGEHIFNHGRDINTIGKLYVITNGPVYRLKTPTKYIPTKSESVFHPDVITDNGKIRIPFWNNPNIYKSTIPILITNDYFKSNN